MAAINQKTFDRIRKAAQGYKGTRAQLGAEYGVSERTVRKILAAESWKDYKQKNLATSRKAMAAQKARAEAEKSIQPPVDDLVIPNPDGPKIVDEIHVYPTNPPVLIRTPAVRDLGQISPEVCGWIREAADLSPELRGIIGALAVWSPEHLTEHLALLHDSLDRRCID